mmetsp:Transcript_3027/g.9302  ORF Transcript_3027/g.9302 Transcript_3027/m.9302 type:complete len:212 (+) Transcript_3027:770-1405(+)
MPRRQRVQRRRHSQCRLRSRRPPAHNQPVPALRWLHPRLRQGFERHLRAAAHPPHRQRRLLRRLLRRTTPLLPCVPEATVMPCVQTFAVRPTICASGAATSAAAPPGPQHTPRGCQRDPVLPQPADAGRQPSGLRAPPHAPPVRGRQQCEWPWSDERRGSLACQALCLAPAPSRLLLPPAKAQQTHPSPGLPAVLQYEMKHGIPQREQRQH